MSGSKPWKLPAIGCIALALLTVRPGCTGRRPDEVKEQRGEQTITVTDTANGAIVGQAKVNVVP
jgi:hypothetical protein